MIRVRNVVVKRDKPITCSIETSSQISAVDSSVIYPADHIVSTVNSPVWAKTIFSSQSSNSRPANNTISQLFQTRAKTLRYCDDGRRRPTSIFPSTSQFSSARFLKDFLSTKSSQAGSLIECQMDATETVVGEQTEQGEKFVNTIVDSSTPVQTLSIGGPLDQLSHLASSEPLFSFADVTSRWVPLPPIPINTSSKAGDLIKLVTLLDDIFRAEIRSPSLMFVRNFVSGRFSVDVKGVVNSNAFNQGMVIMSVKHDVYQSDGLHNSINADLARKHVIFNLSTNATQRMNIPFRYSRPLVPLAVSAQTSGSIRPLTFARLYVRMLSPFVNGANSRTTVDLRLYVRFSKAEFAGMTFDPTIAPQIGMWEIIADVGMTLCSIISGNPVPATRVACKYIERGVDVLNTTFNFDRPVDLKVTRIVPQPSVDFACGKGVSNAQSLRVNPRTGTNMIGISPCNDDPQSFYDIARMWGLEGSFTWSADHKEDEQLLTWVPDPSLRYIESDSSSVPPLRYATSCFAFWSGPIELKFVFVCSKSGHSGSVMISFEPFHESSNDIQSIDSASTYFKEFQLGEQQEVDFVVPYIDVNIMRKTCAAFGNFLPFEKTTELVKRQALNLAILMQNRVKVRVVNVLRPLSTVPPAIEVLMFMRGGENFNLHQLKPSTYLPRYFVPVRPDFPGNFGEKSKHPENTDHYGERDFFKYRPVAVSDDQLRTAKLEPSYRSKRLTYSAILAASKKEQLQSIKLRDEIMKFKQLHVASTKLSTRDLAELGDLSDDECSVQVQEATTTPAPTTTEPESTEDQEPEASTSVSQYTEYAGRSEAFGTTPVYNLYYRVNNKRVLIPVPTASTPTRYKWNSKWYLYDPGNPSNLYYMDHNKTYGNIVEGQMMEEEDQTPNFSQGSSAVVEQTLDIQMNFKDILRRPTLLAQQIVIGPHYLRKDSTVKNQSIGFFIPVELPNYNMLSTDNSFKNNFYSQTLAYTPMYIVTSMFNNWRGDIQYVIVVHSSDAVVYVYHVPDGNTRIQGEHSLGEGCARNIPVYGAGFPLEIISCRVNNVATIEVPFATNETWKKIHECDATTNYTWQDKTRTNCGHLVLWCRDPVVVDIWVRGGDDIAVSNFYGMPNVRTSDHMVHLKDTEQPPMLIPPLGGVYQYKSTLPTGVSNANALTRLTTAQPQMMSWVKDSAVCTAKWIHAQWVKPNPLLDISLASIPVIGGGLVTTRKIHQIESTFSADGAAMNLARNLQTQHNFYMGALTELARYAIDELKKVCKVTVDMATSLFDFMMDLLIAWASKSWVVVGMSLFKVVAKLMFTDGSYMTVISQFAEKFAQIMRDLIQPQGPSTDDSYTSLYGLLVGLVGMLTGVTLDPKRTLSIPRALFTALTTVSGVAYINHVIRLTISIFECVTNLFKQVLGYKSLKNHALIELGENSEIVRQFITEAQIVTNEMNDGMLILPHYRMRLWKCVLQAEQLLRYLAQVPNNSVHRVLYDLCRDVVKLGNRKFNYLKSCPVRIEPFVVALEGVSNCGKSHAMKIIARACAKAIDYRVANDGYIYFRSSGEKYWDGYTDQFCIGYDDFGQILNEEMLSTLYSEVFKLRSPSTFIPNMAAVEDKGQKCNPSLVLFSTNDAFPNTIDKYVSCKKAFLRRRDLVVWMERLPNFEGVNLSSPNAGVTDKMEHLKVQFYVDPNDHLSRQGAPWHTFETVLKKIVQDFKVHHYNEMRKLKTELNQYFEDVCGPRSEELRLTDPFSLYYRPRRDYVPPEPNSDWVASEEMKRYIEDICSQVELQNLEPEIPVEEPMPLEDLPTIEPQSWNERPFDVIECSVCKRCTNLALKCVCGFVVCGDSCCERFTSGVLPICSRCPSFMDVHMLEEIYLYLYRYKRHLLGHHNVFKWFTNQYCVRSTTTSAGSLLNFLKIVKDRLGYMYSYSVNALTWHLALDPSIVSGDGISLGVYIDGRIRCKHKLFLAAKHVYWDGEMYRSDNYPEGVPNFNCCVDDDLNPLNDCPFQFHEAASVYRAEFYQNIAKHFSNIVRAPLGGGPTPRLNTEYGREHEMIPYYQNGIPPLFKIYLKGDDVHEILEGFSWQDYIDWPALGYMKCLQYTVTFITYGYMLYRVVQMCNSLVKCFDSSEKEEDNKPEQQGNYDEGRTRKLVRKVKVVRVKPKAQSADLDAPEDVFEAVQAKVVKNTMLFTLVNPKKEKQIRCYGIGIYNRYVCMPRHYKIQMLGLDKEVVVYAEPAGEPHLRQEIFPSWLKFDDVPGSDMCLLKLPASFPMFKDLRRYMATEQDHATRGLPRKGYIMSPPMKRADREFFKEIMVDITGYYDDLRTNFNGHEIVSENTIQYNYSQPGMCGAVLMARNTQRPILGMHVAGTSTGYGYQGLGFSALLVAEIFDDSDVAAEVEDVKQVDHLVEMQMSFCDEDQVRVCGAVPAKLTPRQPHKSKLVPSLLYTNEPSDFLYSNKEPAILTIKDERYQFTTSPLTAGVKKHGKLTVNFPKTVLDMAEEMLWHGSFEQLKPCVVNPGILTYREAVVGLLEPEYVPLRLDNSAGWPWCVMGGSTKDYWIKTDLDQNMAMRKVFFDKRLIEALRERLEMREQGIVPPSVYIDTLKDEKRSPEKVASLGGTRVFCNGDVSELIEYRRQGFMHLTAAKQRQRMNPMRSIVGINPMSSEWSVLTHKLLTKNKKVITIDYSNFGPGFNAEVHRRICNLQKRWIVKYVRGANPLVIDCLHEGVINSYHLAKNVVYMQFSGSPSGAGPTTMNNTDVNEFYLLCAWIQMCLDNGVVNIWDEYINHVFQALYGDDALMSVTQKYILKYNATTISEYFSKFKIVATNAVKTGAIQPFVPLDEATLLKRGFLPHPTRKCEYLSPLDWNSLLSITQWVWESEDDQAAVIQNCGAALLLAHQHGPEKFSLLKDVINTRFEKLGISPMTLTWQEIDVNFFGAGVDVDLLWK